MASTPITAQTAAVVSPLRDLTDGSVAKAASKSEFASNVSRFFKSRKLKVTKNPPPPPIRVSKVTTGDSAASEVTGQKSVSSTGNGPFYDDAWDIRLSRLGLQASQAQSIPPPPPPALPSLKQRQNSGGRGPPDGAAMCESSCSLTSTPSVALSSGFVDAPAPRTTISTFAPSVGQSSSPPHTDSKVAPTASEEAAPPSTESDPPEGVATPTPSSNLNWFPPPPPTPLHLSLHVDDPASSQPRRYHEHRRSFEMDDEQLLTGNESGDAITLPPLSPPPPQENACPNGDGRASVSSFLLNLPPPPTVTDLPAEESAHPPVIPPRDPKTSVTTPTGPPVTDLDSHLPTAQPAPLSKPREGSELLKSQQRQQRCGVDGRSVVPWERGAPPTSTAIDLSGSLPQWVPPQHSEASLLHRAPRSIGHRSTKSQSGSDGIGDDRVPRPLSLAASGRSQSQHRGRRHTTHTFGDETVVAGNTPTNGSSDRRAVRMDSDSAVMAAARTMMSAGDVWTTAVSRDENDSADKFVRMGCELRQHPVAHSNAHHQRLSGANQRQALAAGAVANADLMTQSLIDWPGCDDTTSASGLHRQRQQQRICHRMKAVHLTDSGLVLSPQDATSLPVYHHGRRIFFSSSSSNKTSPSDMPPGGYFFQSQVSCPPHLGGKINVDEAVWADGSVFEYQTAPAHAYPGQAYMLWPPHQFVSGRRRRNQNHHPTQPIIVPTGDESALPIEKRSTSVKSGVGHNGRPQVLVTGRHRSKRAADLAALVSLPVEEQPWFHGRLPRAEAESLLRSAPPGSFLVRTSESSKAAFSLSIRRDRDFLHMKISYDPKSEAYILGEYSQPYPTVPIMVHHYTRNLLPVRGTKPVLLKYPLCRAMSPFTLQTP